MFHQEHSSLFIDFPAAVDTLIQDYSVSKQEAVDFEISRKKERDSSVILSLQAARPSYRYCWKSPCFTFHHLFCFIKYWFYRHLFAGNHYLLLEISKNYGQMVVSSPVHLVASGHIPCVFCRDEVLIDLVAETPFTDKGPRLDWLPWIAFQCFIVGEIISWFYNPQVWWDPAVNLVEFNYWSSFWILLDGWKQIDHT